MKTNTQLNWVRDQLIQYGKVSRNDALKIRNTRLGARIVDLKREGWNIIGKTVKENGGKNYYYYLVSKPRELKKHYWVENGKAYSAETYE